MGRVLVLSALVLMLLAPAARADDVASPTEQILRPWVQQQTPDGAFPDWPGTRTGGAGGYAESILGLALATQGLRTGDAAMTAAGERGLSWALDHPSLVIAPRQSVFEDLAFAAALDDLGPRLSPGLRERLRQRVEATSLVRHVGLKYNNHTLAEAVRIVTADHAGALISEADRLNAVRLLGTVLPHYGRLYRGRVAGRRTSVVSDPAANPVAYQSLTLGLLARAVVLLGPSASREEKRLVVAMAEGAAALMAPDGDSAYWGRSQEESWALSFTAYGAQVAARIAPRTAPRMRALARKALDRLNRLHVRPEGLLLTPGLADPSADGDPRAGLDEYASLPAYTGLTAMALHWLDPRFLEGRTSRLRAARRGGWRNGGRSSAFATVRTSTRWWAVKLRGAFNRSDDGRWDFGLVAFKRREPAGGWRDVLPLRPYERRGACVREACTAPPPTLGPAAVTSRGLARPVGDHLRVRGQRVTIRGRWVRPDGATHAPMTVAYRPHRRGVRVTWRGFARRQVFQLGGLFDERRGPVCRRGRTIGNAGGSLRLPPIRSLAARTGLASAAQRPITSVTATVVARGRRPLSAVYGDDGLRCP